MTYEPVTIGKSVWLPWRVFVMPGSTIGDGSVIGANSLVAGTIPPYSLAVGTPAKVIRSAPDFPRKPDAAQRSVTIISRNTTSLARLYMGTEDLSDLFQRLAAVSEFLNDRAPAWLGDL